MEDKAVLSALDFKDASLHNVLSLSLYMFLCTKVDISKPKGLRNLKNKLPLTENEF